MHFEWCCCSIKCISRMSWRSLISLQTVLNLSVHEQRLLVSRATYPLPQMNKCKGWRRRMLEQQLCEVVLRSHSWPLSLSLATIAMFKSGNPRNLLRKPELAKIWGQFWDQMFKGLISFQKITCWQIDPELLRLQGVDHHGVGCGTGAMLWLKPQPCKHLSVPTELGLQIQLELFEKNLWSELAFAEIRRYISEWRRVRINSKAGMACWILLACPFACYFVLVTSNGFMAPL